MAYRKKRDEHDNHDRWLVSYADFITLLFAFFVVMYSLSSVNKGKYQAFSDSLRGSFSAKPKIKELDAGSKSGQQELLKMLVAKREARESEVRKKNLARMQSMTEGLVKAFGSLVSQQMVNINQAHRGVTLDISASSLFKAGEASLQPDSVEVLRRVASVLQPDDFLIEVEGHTDDIPISTSQFPSNWELSSARASSVVRVLIENGVSPTRLTVVGRASNQPLVPNLTAETRAKNRRVTITIFAASNDLSAATE